MADKSDRAPVLGGGPPGRTGDAPGTPAPVTRGQRWLATHGHVEHEGKGDGTVDITRTYVRQQVRSRFIVST